ncbi:F-box domain, cyclin-like [Pleurostoma richardsiae]|uniref:F-box domain, cyclin-like n=1 Tax=Pleurostoma richardsiae TaxID=41990 RepID=A0AA38VN88_9PEZI|nr:F-box domain, cyclin-like [Pleurostoma richardsiae]
MATSSSTLLQLPAEILTAIPLYLSNRDVKSLRLSCKALHAISLLRLDRVFLSANPRNIEVFRAISEHEVLRRQILEIIWDDARLKDEPGSRKSGDPESPNFDPGFDGLENMDEDEDYYDDGDGEDEYDDANEGYPQWFVKACGKNLQDIKSHENLDVDRPDHVARAELIAQISLKRSWQYYEQLLQQQRDVLATGSDAEAFEYGLQRFPALQRITITPAAHGLLFRPLYETPMIRAFPPSFNYPNPCSWPVKKQTQRLWEDTSESEKDTWRGFRIVMRALAASGAASCDQQQQKRVVTEIVVEVNQLLTGLNAHIFDEGCPEQRDLVTILRRPNFRRLDLALAVGGLEHYGWRAFRSGCLRRTLAAAPELEHASFETDLADEPDPSYNGLPSGDHHFIPLRDVLPVDAWTCLRHFGLARFPVRQGDLLSFLAALPATLRSVELSFLFFSDGNYRDLVADLRDQLGWRGRPAEQRPRVAIGLPDTLGLSRRGIWADRPVEEFIYHDGLNPFGADGWGVNQIPYGLGGVVKDAFDPAFERPWVDYNELKRLGYIKA